MKKTVLYALGAFLAADLALYFLMHLRETTGSNFVLCLSTFFACILTVLPFTLAVPLIANGKRGKKGALSLLFFVPYLVYFCPTYYASYTEEGYGTWAALALVVAVGVLFILMFALVAWIFAQIVNFIRKSNRTESQNAASAFDLKDGETLALFVPNFLVFLAFTVSEIVDTVSYLTEYAGTYRTDEIVYMLVRYAAIISSLLISQYLSVKANFISKSSNM